MSDPAASTDAADAAEAASGSAFVPGEKPGAAGKAALTPVEGLLRQVEYYFSAANLRGDAFLRDKIAADEGGFVNRRRQFVQPHAAHAAEHRGARPGP